MIHKITLTFIAVLLTGCQALSHKAVTEHPTPTFASAQEAFEDGQYYRARKMTEKLLVSDPEDAESQELMAEILEKEISTQKQVFQEKVPVEYDAEERLQMTRTWLERAHQLFRMNEYSEALTAAETVFKYDPQNLEASELIDKIRKQVYKEGKADAVFLKNMYRDEIDQRVVRYKEQARSLMDKGQWAAAKLTIEKAILLDSGDREAGRIREMILNRKEA